MDRVSIYITLIFFLLIISPLWSAIKNLYNFIVGCINTSKKTMILNDELNNLSKREFEMWCSKFLKGNDFEEVQLSAEGSEIKCSKNGIPYYVDCRKSLNNRPISLNIEDIKIMVGAMVGNNIKNGIIITTGKISDEALRFIETLPEGISIKYFEGEYFNIELYSLDYVPVIN